MLLEILKILFILLIAVPFIFMFAEVLVDVVKRAHEFYRRIAKPALLNLISSIMKF